MQHKRDTILAVIFCGVLSVCAAGFWLEPRAKVSSIEYRPLASLPKLRWKTLADYPANFDTFFSDHMFGKTELIRERNLASLRVFAVSGSPQVAAGTDGWFYYAGGDLDPLIRHESEFSSRALTLWYRNLHRRTALLGRQGIRYIFVVAPDKNSIYPEHLPDSLKPCRATSQLDQLRDLFRGYPEVSFVDLRQSLMPGKSLGQLYYKTDTHWNDLGALLGYNQLATVLGGSYSAIKPLPLSDMVVTTKNWDTGDCTRMMGLGTILRDPGPTVKLSKRPTPAPQKVLFLHDSFGEFFKKYLKTQFAVVESRRSSSLGFDVPAAIAAKPDVVIQEVVERTTCLAGIDEWRTWAASVIGAHQGAGSGAPSLCIFPNTADVNLYSFNLARRESEGHCIAGTTLRAFEAEGDRVRFSPEAIRSSEWVLIKDGNQGRKFADAQSPLEYQKSIDFVKRNYEEWDALGLKDGSNAILYRLKKQPPADMQLAGDARTITH